MKITARWAIALLLMALTIAVDAEEAVTLRYHFTPGEVHTYDLNVTGCGQIIIDGAPERTMTVPLDMILNGTLDLLTREVDAEGNGHLGCKLGAFAVEMTAVGRTVHMVMDPETGKLTVDGQEMPPAGAGPVDHVERPAEAPAALLPNAVLDKLTFVMSPRGVLVDMQGLEELAAGMGTGNPLGELQSAMMPNLQEMLKGYTPAFPEGEVKPGDTWEQSFQVPVPGQTEPRTLTVQYTLEDLGKLNDHQVARLGMVGEWEVKNLDIPAKAGQPSPGKIDLLTVNLDGQIYFDVTAGAMHSALLALGLEMEMTGTAPPPEVEKPEPAPEGDQGAGGPAPEGDQPAAAAPPVGDNQNQVKISLKNMKFYYNVVPHDGQLTAPEG